MLAFILAMAVASAPAATDPSVRCAAVLAALAKQGSVEATSKGSTVTMAGVDVRLTAKIEDEQQSGSKWLLGLAVAASVPGNKSPVIAGSVGVGSDRADAMETAIQEWAQLAGVALVRAIAVKEKSREIFHVAGHVIYPGSTGIRGSQELSWSKSNHEQLLALLSPVLERLEPSQLHSLSLSIAVDSNGVVQGQCHVDGTPSSSAFAAAKRFPWPKPKRTYMFKQYYVAQTIR